MDALNEGSVTTNDRVTISANAASLSRTADGVITMDPGEKANLLELLYALLLPSSNESALALAEHVAGSEEAFVERMNEKARKLGLSEATYFYNCNGLPKFTDSVAASKIQNHMSARDMFIMVSALLEQYPQVLEITSTKEKELTSFNRVVKNTNALLYNMPGVVGLKTGTTNASGASLVSAAKMEDTKGNPHIIVAIEFGAEDGASRNTLSQLILRYGCQEFISNPNAAPEKEEAPLSKQEALIRSILEDLGDSPLDSPMDR